MIWCMYVYIYLIFTHIQSILIHMIVYIYIYIQYI